MVEKNKGVQKPVDDMLDLPPLFDFLSASFSKNGESPFNGTYRVRHLCLLADYASTVESFPFNGPSNQDVYGMAFAQSIVRPRLLRRAALLQAACTSRLIAQQSDPNP
jgi:hypothetical protein